MNGIIYKLENKINNKVYIGQTTQEGGFDERYANNIENNTHNQHLKRSIKKYGIENFYIDKEFDTSTSQEELNDKEIYWINYYNATDPKHGYNKREGGNGGALNKETKSKISETKHINRDAILYDLLDKMKKDGMGKFYNFNITDYDKNMYMEVPLNLVLDCDNEIDTLSICAICYLYMNTNKLGYSIFNLKELIEKCGFNKSNSRIISKLKDVLVNLQDYEYIDKTLCVDSIKLNSVLKTKLNINTNFKCITINIFDINKLMELNISEETSKVLRIYLYLIHLANSPHNIVNGIVNIREELGFHKETILKYLNILTENNLIYYCDLGYIKTSLGTIRGGTCYATTEQNLEIIKNNVKKTIVI